MKNIIYIILISVAPMLHAGNDPRASQPSEILLPAGFPEAPPPAAPVIAPPAPLPTVGVAEGVVATVGTLVAFGGMMFVAYNMAFAL